MTTPLLTLCTYRYSFSISRCISLSVTWS